MTKRESAGKPTGGQFAPDTSGATNIPTPNYPDTGTWTENVHNHFSKELLPIGQCPRCDERFSKEEMEEYVRSVQYEAYKQTLVNGCSVCGDPQRNHGMKYTQGAGLHNYEEPNDEQRKERLLRNKPQTESAAEVARKLPAKVNPAKTLTPVWDETSYGYTYNEAVPTNEEPRDYTAIITKYPYLTVHASGCKHLSGKNIDSVGRNTKTLSAFKLEVMNNVDQDHDYDWKIKLAPCAVQNTASQNERKVSTAALCPDCNKNPIQTKCWTCGNSLCSECNLVHRATCDDPCNAE